MVLNLGQCANLMLRVRHVHVLILLKSVSIGRIQRSLQ